MSFIVNLWQTGICRLATKADRLATMKLREIQSRSHAQRARQHLQQLSERIKAGVDMSWELWRSQRAAKLTPQLLVRPTVPADIIPLTAPSSHAGNWAMLRPGMFACGLTCRSLGLRARSSYL